MHRLITFAPINMQEANGAVIVGQDPEKTIDTVCHPCNNGWMSQLEERNVPRLKPMLLNAPIVLDEGGLKLLCQWAVKTAMVAESIKFANSIEKFFTPDERAAMRTSRSLPTRTRTWIGALSQTHIGCHGTDFTIVANGGNDRIGTGSVCTIYAGHFVVQTVTEHLHPPYVSDSSFLIAPPASSCDERLLKVYPGVPKKLAWPPMPFEDNGPGGIMALMDRWRTGEKVDRIPETK